MTQELRDKLEVALSKVADPELHRPITELGMVESIEIVDGTAKLSILLTISGCPMRDRLQRDISQASLEVSGIKNVEIAFGVMSDQQRDRVKSLLRGGREKFIPFAQPDSLTRVIAIASGKGGVGKSSLTVNLAVELALLDGDVYGHSIPRALGIEGKRPTAIDQTFIPIEAHGIKTVSIEMFKPDRADPVAYRGPLLHRVLEQLLSDAYWGDLDYLLLDLPPGTGDVAISLGQLIPNSEIIVVTTPQIAAAEVAERAGRIAHQLKQRIIGVIENMSAYTPRNSNVSVALFGEGGGEETAKRLSILVGADVPLLGSVPFDPDLRIGGDLGAPIVTTLPNSESALAIARVVDQLVAGKRSLLGVKLGLST